MIPAMALLFIGAGAAWYGFVDPTGGIMGAAKRIMSGAPAAGQSAAPGATVGGAIGAGARLTTFQKQAITFAELFGNTSADASASGAGDGYTGSGSSVRINPDGTTTKGDAAGNFPSSTTTKGNASGDAIVAYARTYLGTPYVYGGHTKKGFDCAGFTHYVAQHFGVGLAWYVGGQLASSAFTKVSKADLQPGDFVFYGVHHVAIYVGNNSVIHAPKPGTVVRIEGGMGNTTGPLAYRRLKVSSKGTAT